MRAFCEGMQVAAIFILAIGDDDQRIRLFAAVVFALASLGKILCD
jgi:hypothetical protein